MDPNVTLQELRERITELALSSPNDFILDIANKFEALDQWLKNGGFLPDDWARR